MSKDIVSKSDKPAIVAYKKGSPPARIIKAGRKLFFKKGFEKVSTDMLVKEAKVSKASLYKYFKNMSEVLQAVVKEESKNFDGDLKIKFDTAADLKNGLINYGTGVLTFLNKAEIIQFTNLMHEEARTHPEVASLFYESAYEQSHLNLTEMLQHGLTQGYLSSPLKASELAEQFMGMLEGVQLRKALMGLTKKPFEKPKDWATKCVVTLLGI